MARRLAELNVVIGAKLSKFEKGLNKVEKRLNRFSRKMGRIGSDLTRAVTLPIIGIAAVSLRAFDKQEKALAQVKAGLKATGGGGIRIPAKTAYLQQLFLPLTKYHTFYHTFFFAFLDRMNRF